MQNRFPILLLICSTALAGCSGGFSLDPVRDLFRPAQPTAAAQPATVDPDAPPPPAEDARTPDDFDTTSEADRAAASAADEGGADLGSTSATLGDPTLPGFWLETPLVTEVTQGRISYMGRWISVELRPSGGVAGSGSRISLAAMRLLDAPLTAIIDIRVSAG